METHSQVGENPEEVTRIPGFKGTNFSRVSSL